MRNGISIKERLTKLGYEYSLSNSDRVLIENVIGKRIRPIKVVFPKWARKEFEKRYGGIGEYLLSTFNCSRIKIPVSIVNGRRKLIIKGSNSHLPKRRF